MTDIIIIGAGPAGLTAAIYARRAGKSVLLIEKSAFGGQMTFSPKIENYPGFVSVSGTELADKMVEQALAQGAEVEFAEATNVAPVAGGYAVTCDTGVLEAKAVIFATGARHRHLGVPGEEALIGSGISFCAICDGAFYADRDVAVIGGGNSALVETLQLAEVCRSVTVLQDLPALTGEARLQELIYANPKIRVICHAKVTGFEGEDALTAVRYTDQGGAEQRLAVPGAFVAIGLVPQMEAFRSVVALDARGYADADERCVCPTAGLFVAGDCRSKQTRQISTAIADGASAALAACAYLDAKQ